MKEFKIIWKSLAGHANHEWVASADLIKVRRAYDKFRETIKSSDFKKLTYPTFEAIAQDFDKEELQENPLFKTAYRLLIVIADDETGKEMEVEADKYVYFFKTTENAELYDNFKAYVNKLLFSFTV